MVLAIRQCGMFARCLTVLVIPFELLMHVAISATGAFTDFVSLERPWWYRARLQHLLQLKATVDMENHTANHIFLIFSDGFCI